MNAQPEPAPPVDAAPRRRPRASAPPLIRWRRLAAIIVVVLALFALGLFLEQERLIYFPRRYDQAALAASPGGLQPLGYRVAGAGHTAFWRPPAAPDGRCWAFFGGNGALALDWSDFVHCDPDPGAGYLLVDYPGYGANPGKPSPASIDAAVDAAIAAAAATLHREPATLLAQGGIVGHSLGAAVALRCAQRHEAKRLVLLAPFTSMLAMARRRVMWPFCEVLTHRYDNRAALAALGGRTPRPWVTILHGDADQFIPVEMGRALARENPWVEYRELRGIGHNDIVDLDCWKLIAAAMRGRIAGEPAGPAAAR